GAWLNQEAGWYENALEDYERVLQLEPRNSDAFRGMGSVYGAMNAPDKAVAAYRQAVDLDPPHYMPYAELGVYYYRHSQYLPAAAEFRKAIEHAPGVAQPYLNLGAALSDLGNDAEAEPYVRASLKLKENASGYNSLGA